jgi:hypothetical protein
MIKFEMFLNGELVFDIPELPEFNLFPKRNAKVYAANDEEEMDGKSGQGQNMSVQSQSQKQQQQRQPGGGDGGGDESEDEEDEIEDTQESNASRKMLRSGSFKASLNGFSDYFKNMSSKSASASFSGLPPELVNTATKMGINDAIVGSTAEITASNGTHIDASGTMAKSQASEPPPSTPTTARSRPSISRSGSRLGKNDDPDPNGPLRSRPKSPARKPPAASPNRSRPGSAIPDDFQLPKVLSKRPSSRMRSRRGFGGGSEVESFVESEEGGADNNGGATPASSRPSSRGRSSDTGTDVESRRGQRRERTSSARMQRGILSSPSQQQQQQQQQQQPNEDQDLSERARPSSRQRSGFEGFLTPKRERSRSPLRQRSEELKAETDPDPGAAGPASGTGTGSVGVGIAGIAGRNVSGAKTAREGSRNRMEVWPEEPAASSLMATSKRGKSVRPSTASAAVKSSTAEVGSPPKSIIRPMTPQVETQSQFQSRDSSPKKTVRIIDD